jgi:hypothetical protein
MKSIKNKLKLFGIVPVLLLCLSFSEKKTCNSYYIDNSAFGCAITYDISITSNFGCVFVCHSASGDNVAASTKQLLPCGMCTNQCNITITVTSIGGNLCTPTIVDFNTTGPVIIGGPSCGVNTIEYDGIDSFIFA